MILQELTVKEVEEGELYYRKENNIEICEGKLTFTKDAKLKTNTYFNSFSIEKWNEFCDLKRINLRISYSGKFHLKVHQAHIVNDELQETVICDNILKSNVLDDFIYTFSSDIKGVVYYELTAIEDESVLCYAFYEGEIKKERDVKIALNICTYNREKFLFKNLFLLKQNFLENSDSCLVNHLKIFITDNASTWDIEKYTNQDIFIFHNPNEGGAGGFTRGLIEINKRKEEFGITNVIFMDDDVEIEPEALVRTYRFLKVLKEKYENSFLAGAMLRMDKKYIQHENGALWNGGNCSFINRGFDLRQFKNVVSNELEQKRDYAAWWYCCIPIAVVKTTNLPIPIFIHQDDTEFSLRNTDKIITLNGISIWHTADDYVRLSSNEYYNLRNLLIVNARYCPEFNMYKVGRKALSKMLVALLRYRYKDMSLIYRAVKDFCKGPQWLIETDPEELHNELRELGYQFMDLSEEIQRLEIKQKKTETASPFRAKKKQWTLKGILRLILIIITANGWILPAKKHEYHYMNVHPARLYRTGKVTLHDGIARGIRVKREFAQIFVFFLLYVKIWKLLLSDYGTAKKEYHDEWERLINLNERISPN